MNAIIRNLLAGIGGVVVGSIVNMALVNVGPSVVPLPEGASVSSMEGLRESMSLFTTANFIFPFLGHALGTLVGAFAAVKLAASDHMKVALGVGVFFLIGGAMMVKMIGGPMWYNMVDLLLAYLPMGFLSGALARRKAS
ncbi:MAG: hypothetical protein GWQ05_02155 [Verrucomicrobiaceae bacterium]|nr:hypothetical protein [Verrucomicrobiaceae bacterium]